MSISIPSVDVSSMAIKSEEPRLEKTPPSLPSVRILIERLEGKYQQFRPLTSVFEDWGYEEIFSVEDCNRIMRNYLNRKATEAFLPIGAFGEMISQEIQKDGCIVVHGDLHTDLHTLIERLKYLQKIRSLNSDYKIIQDNDPVRMVFLGDYFDRGRDGIKLFMTLLLFKMENWNGVDLYRGNHESICSLINNPFPDEKKFYKNALFSTLLDRVFETLILRGYYSSSPDFPQKRREHVVVTHGIPGYYPTAQEVFSKKKLYVTNEENPVLDRKIEELALLPTRDFFQTYHESGEEKKYFAAIKSREIIELHKLKLNSEWKRGSLLELWGDVTESNKNASVNTTRKVGLVVPPTLLKAFCRINADEENRIVAIIKGHGHVWKIFPSGEKYFNEGFIHQLPVGGTHPLLSAIAGKTDLFYILQVKPKVKEWRCFVISKSLEELDYNMIEGEFYGSRKFDP